MLSAVLGVLVVAAPATALRSKTARDVLRTVCSTLSSLLVSVKQDDSSTKAAEDTFYIHEYGGRDPMIGKFWFEGTSSEEFEAVVKALGERLGEFLEREYHSR